MDDRTKYDEYCDRVPGTGKVILAVTFMEKEVRKVRIALSFYQSDSAGALKSSFPCPQRFILAECCDRGCDGRAQGKICPEDCAWRGKEKEDIIEMPIFVGQ